MVGVATEELEVVVEQTFLVNDGVELTGQLLLAEIEEEAEEADETEEVEEVLEEEVLEEDGGGWKALGL
jgi:hypothetical protein